MLLLHTLCYPRWLGSYKSRMDYCQLDLEGWLDNATFFPNEPVDYNFNFENLVDKEKANDEVEQNTSDLCDLEWLDEKADVSALGGPNGLLIQPNDAEMLILQDAANFLGLTDSSNYDLSYLSSVDLKQNEIFDLVVPDFQSGAVSSNVLESSISSPSSSLLNVNSADFATPVQSPSSSGSDILGEYNIDVHSPTNSVSSYYSDTGFENSTNEVKVTVYNQDDGSNASSAAPEEYFNIEEVSNSLCQKKYKNLKELPKIRVNLKKSCHPYGKASKAKDRKSRKKEQNKEAAARYRSKKKLEERELFDEVAHLESEQKDLRKKHDDLQTEIKYLKSLMCEILEKRGILKK